MSIVVPLRPRLSEETCRQFAVLVLLDRLVATATQYHAALLEGDDGFLEGVFDTLLREDLVAIDDADHYRPTPLGRTAYRRMLHQQQSYLAHFDIFAGVDLAEGVFAEVDDPYLEDPRWSDLRVAVALYKGIDPFRMVFLSTLAAGDFFDNPGWKFDMALGSSFFKGLEEIVATQITMNDLGYEDEDGTFIEGEDVLEDVILQGAQANLVALEQEAHQQLSLLDDAEDDPSQPGADAGGSAGPDGDGASADRDAILLVPYDALGPARAYAGSARFVEPIWLERYW